MFTKIKTKELLARIRSLESYLGVHYADQNYEDGSKEHIEGDWAEIKKVKERVKLLEDNKSTK